MIVQLHRLIVSSSNHHTNLYPAEAGCEGVGDEGLHAAELASLVGSADLAGVRITRLLPDEEFLNENIFKKVVNYLKYTFVHIEFCSGS